MGYRVQRPVETRKLFHLLVLDHVNLFSNMPRTQGRRACLVYCAYHLLSEEEGDGVVCLDFDMSQNDYSITNTAWAK